MEKINPSTLDRRFSHLITQVVVTPPSSLAFISGQVAVNQEGELIGINDYRQQALQVFKNINLALEAAGAKPEHVVQMKIHVVHHREELVEVIFQAGFEVFGEEWPLTASTLLGVQALGMPDWLIEVDVIAAIIN
ncbi:RidA family protein [Paenibacillus sp. P96]|uniref:RidA family protein n=1 Tax=Paenibacillus zeirhizosphaerae TaxID=2987519 RepID=A0ABT9FT01_9BACL|nr:RidA family protein [Paenibacillus sp. P96]MDP4097831.1 RidA family protein [Paenibacillus sp. P96]